TEDAARAYVSTHADQFGVLPADVSDLSVLSSYADAGTGVTHVNLTQHRDGYDVFGTGATVSFARDGHVVFAGGDLVKGLDAGSAEPTVGATEAVESAAKGLGLDEPDALKVTKATSKSATLTDGGISASPIDAKLGWHAASDGQLKLAWRVIIDDASAS